MAEAVVWAGCADGTGSGVKSTIGDIEKVPGNHTSGWIKISAIMLI